MWRKHAASSGFVARIVDFEPPASGIDVHLTHRRSREGGTVWARAVFERRVRVPDVTQSEKPVLLDLLFSGATAQDALGLGLDVIDACEVTDASVGGSERIYSLGPLTAGSFWEIVAIPDIRQQAKRLAEHLVLRAQ